MTTTPESTQVLTAEIFIEAPVSQLYYLFSTRSGWFDWFAHKGIGYVCEGGVLQMRHDTAGLVTFLFQELVPEERIAFTFLNPETLHPSPVEFTLEDTGEGVVVRVKHSDLEAGEAAWLEDFWQHSLDNLKQMLEAGKDSRLWDRPLLGINVADWVSPEVAAEKNLATDTGMHLSRVYENLGAAQAGLMPGDTVVSLAGIKITDYESLRKVYQEHKAGETIDVEYYRRDEFHQAKLTLSALPMPEVPTTAQDIADQLEQFFNKVNSRIEKMLAWQHEAQTECRPGPGEWSAKEVLAHLIASETDSIHWLASYIAGKEITPNTAETPTRIRSLVALYPTTEALMEKFRQTQRELLILISEIPADVVSRKTSLIRLTVAYSLNISYHYKDHLAQLEEALQKAEDVAVN